MGRTTGMRRVIAGVAMVTALGVLSSGWPTMAGAQEANQSRTGGRVAIEAVPPIAAPNGSADLKPALTKTGDHSVPGKSADVEFDPSREIVSERTATSAVSQLEDGSRVVQFFDTPAFYPTAKGFEPIDNTVEAHPSRPGVPCQLIRTLSGSDRA